MLNALLPWIFVPLLPTYSMSTTIVLRDLLLNAEVPVLVIAHACRRVYAGVRPTVVLRRTERRAQVEVRQACAAGSTPDRSARCPRSRNGGMNRFTRPSVYSPS